MWRARRPFAERDKVTANELLEAEVRVVNIGLQAFYLDLRARNVAAVQVDWSPPAGGNPKIRDLLAKLGS